MKRTENWSLDQKRKRAEQKRAAHDREKEPGYGNKKLEGPNRPST